MKELQMVMDALVFLSAFEREENRVESFDLCLSKVFTDYPF